MRRREFIALLGGAAAAWPLAAKTQQSAMPIVGFVSTGSADGSASRATAFRKGLSESGYVEGQNVTVEYHWLEGRPDGLPAVMASLGPRQGARLATPATTVASPAGQSPTLTEP